MLNLFERELALLAAVQVESLEEELEWESEGTSFKNSLGSAIKASKVFT